MNARNAPARLPALDLARGVAAVAMIATHACDAFLADAYKHNELWYQLNILFGFVAPAFALLGGVTLWLSLERRADGPAGLPWDIVTRYALVFLAGYWLQLPSPSVQHLLNSAQPAELARLFDANILQVIAIAGVGLVIATRLLGLPKVRIVAAILAVLAAAATPYVWAGDLYTSLPLAVRAYFAPSPPATFGLFPLAAYVFAGFAVAPLAVRAAATTTSSSRAVALLALAGAALLAAGPLLTALAEGHPPHDRFWGSSAQYVLYRAGGVLVLLAACSAIARLRTVRGALRRGNAGESLVEYCGRRSLAIYAVHLVIVYGSPLTMGLRTALAGVLAAAAGPLETFALFAAVTTLTVIAVLTWDALRTARPRTVLWVKRIAWGAFLLLFVVGS